MATPFTRRAPLRLFIVGGPADLPRRCADCLGAAGFAVALHGSDTAAEPDVEAMRSCDLVLAWLADNRSAPVKWIGQLRAAAGDVPVVVLSEAPLGDAATADLIIAGAADLVPGNDLTRLGAAAHRIERGRDQRRGDPDLLHRLTLAVDQSPASVIITDADGHIEYVNRRFVEATGYSVAEVLGRSPGVIKSGLTPPEVYHDLWRTIRRGDEWRGELRNRTRSGALVWHAVTISPIRNAEGAVTHYLGVQEDVTRYKETIRALEERERSFRQVTDNIHEVFFVVASDYSEMIFVSPAYEAIWGRPTATLYANPASFLDAVEPDDRPRLIKSIERNQRGETLGEVEFRVRRPDGEVRSVLAHSVPIRDERGAVHRICGVVMDVTDRRRAEAGRRETETMFRDLIEASFHGVVISEHGIIVEANRGIGDISGYAVEELVGRPVLDLIAPESRGEVARHVAEGIDGRYDMIGLRKDGTRRQLEAAARTCRTGDVVRRVTAVRDVTDTRLLEEQFRLAQRMESVGRLAGGVAHDFNNLLTVITGYAELLREDPAIAASARDDIGEILNAAQAAARLTRQLLAFSRRQVLEPRVLTIEESVAAAEKLLRRVIGEDITLVTALNPAPVPIRIDPGQLEQVIMNLVVNARDAMPAGGQVTIETAVFSMDESYVRGHWPATPGEYVMLAISDTGVGMDRITRERIFEPFFTTKEAGKGTGLGLSTVYGIVKQSGGFIWVYSEPGRGSTFKIYLPRHDAPTDAPLPTPTPVTAGTETVLVVEDDAAVRDVAERILRGCGYQVMVASNAAEALDIAESQRGKLQLLLTDLVMPGASGRELAARLLERHPALPVLYMSGYTDDAAVRQGIVASGAAYLQKPFSPDGLVRKVRQVLDDARARSAQG